MTTVCCEVKSRNEKSPYGINNQISLLLLQLSIDGNTDNFLGKAVGDITTIATGYGQMGKALLLIHRQWIIDLTANPLPHQVLFQVSLIHN